MKLPPILLDSNVLIYCLRQNTKADFLKLLDDFLNQYGVLAISHINVYEILSGSRPKEVEIHKRFLQSFHIIPINADASVKAAKYYRNYRTKGITLSISDLLIAGIVDVNQTNLLTINRAHFPMFKTKKTFKIKDLAVYQLG